MSNFWEQPQPMNSRNQLLPSVNPKKARYCQMVRTRIRILDGKSLTKKWETKLKYRIISNRYNLKASKLIQNINNKKHS